MANSALVESNFEDTWDRLVGELASRYYVINNIDKDSRLINLSFTTNEPSKYVSGGRSTRYFKAGGTVEDVSYDVAEAARYTIGQNAGDFGEYLILTSVVRKPTLEGRANVYIAPEGEGTKVSVNCRYSLAVEISGVAETKNAQGGVLRRDRIPTSNVTAAFSTNEPCTVDWGTPQDPTLVTFTSLGVFENDILDIVRRKQE